MIEISDRRSIHELSDRNDSTMDINRPMLMMITTLPIILATGEDMTIKGNLNWPSEILTCWYKHYAFNDHKELPMIFDHP